MGVVYLVAIMDWYSRRVLSWRVSNTLDASFCVDALEEAIERHNQGGLPGDQRCVQEMDYANPELANGLEPVYDRVRRPADGLW